MALDLFLKPYKPKSRSRSAALAARQALVDALRAAHPQTQLVGDVTRGHVEGFPMGELHFSPTELHWAMHGVDDPEPVHALADWFFDHGFACDDPQGAGFDRPRPKPVAVRGTFEDLVGAEWLGFRFDRNYATALDADFTLPDGRNARLRMLHLGRCTVPELSPLVKARVTGCRFVRGNYDTLAVVFEGGHELAFADAVFGAVRITP